jgi:hypothetical protein
LILFDRQALPALFARDNAGAKMRQIGIGEVQSFGGHAFPFS